VRRVCLSKDEAEKYVQEKNEKGGFFRASPHLTDEQYAALIKASA